MKPFDAIFNYPKEFKTLPEYSAHSGQVVHVIREATPQEADGPEHGQEQMYIIQARDLWTGMAFESELQRI